MDQLKQYIREVPDFPKPGILFYDVTTLLAHADAFKETVDRFVSLFAGEQVEKVIGIESRGFMFGPVTALHLGAGFVPVRKAGKLPWRTIEVSYELEYGTDTVQMHADAIAPGERVLIVDDLIATGGTARATAELVRAAGGDLVGLAFVIELTALGGRQRLSELRVESLIAY